MTIYNNNNNNNNNNNKVSYKQNVQYRSNQNSPTKITSIHEIDKQCL